MADIFYRPAGGAGSSTIETTSTLKFGGGDGTSTGMEALIDAKVAAAEARTDTKFATVLGKLDTLSSDVRAGRDEVRSVRGSIWTAALAVMALILAVVGLVVALVPASFSAGAQMRDLARDEVRAAQPHTPDLSAKATPTSGKSTR